jgi:hypothetical protein
MDVVIGNPVDVEPVLRSNFTNNYPNSPRRSTLSPCSRTSWAAASSTRTTVSSGSGGTRTPASSSPKRSFRRFVVDVVQGEVSNRLLRPARSLTRRTCSSSSRSTPSACWVVFGHDTCCLADGRVLAKASRSESMLAFGEVQDRPVPGPRRGLLEGQEVAQRRHRALPEEGHRGRPRVRHGHRPGAAENRDDVLSGFVASDEALRDVVLSFIISGRGTTSSALAWFFSSGSPRRCRTWRRARPRSMHYLHGESKRLVPAGAHRLAVVRRRRRAARWHARTSARDGPSHTHAQRVRHGKARGRMGRRLRGVQAGAVARRGWRVLPDQPVPVHRVPRRAEDVPREGDGLRGDEIHCRKRSGRRPAGNRCSPWRSE